MRKESSVNLTLTRNAERKMDGGKQRVTYLTCLWLMEQGLRKITKNQNLLRPTKEAKLWRAMIMHILDDCLLKSNFSSLQK